MSENKNNIGLEKLKRAFKIVNERELAEIQRTLPQDPETEHNQEFFDNVLAKCLAVIDEKSHNRENK